MENKTKKIVMTALFAALACVATMSIRIPREEEAYRPGEKIPGEAPRDPVLPEKGKRKAG